MLIFYRVWIINWIELCRWRRAFGKKKKAWLDVLKIWDFDVDINSNVKMMTMQKFFVFSFVGDMLKCALKCKKTNGKIKKNAIANYLQFQNYRQISQDDL